MIMKWLMGDQQSQQVPGTTPPSGTPSNTQAPTLPQPPAPPTPIVFVEAKPPVVPAPIQTTTPAPTPVTLPQQSPAAETDVAAQGEKLPDLPDFQEEKKESTIVVDEKRELTTDLLSEALNSAIEPASAAMQSPFIPTPSSIITPDSTFGAAVISEVKEAASAATTQAVTEEAPAALAGIITSQLPKASLDIPPQEPVFPMVSPEEEPKNEIPVTPIEPKVIPQNDKVTTSSEQEGPDLPDVSADIKRILQERWITLANTELAKLEKRHSDTSTALAELEKTQQELAAKKLKLEADMLEVEQSKAGWDKKKIEAQTTLDRVVKEVSEL